MINKIKEGLGIALIATGVGFVAIVLVVVCTVLRPFGWMIEAAAERQKKLCRDCADNNVDAESALQLNFYRPPGNYVCLECRREYTVKIA